MGKGSEYEEERREEARRRRQYGERYAKRWRELRLETNEFLAAYGAAEYGHLSADASHRALERLTQWTDRSGRDAHYVSEGDRGKLDGGLGPQGPMAVGALCPWLPPQRHLLHERLKLESLPALQRLTASAQRLAWAWAIVSTACDDGDDEAFGVADVAIQIITLVGEIHSVCTPAASPPVARQFCAPSADGAHLTQGSRFGSMQKLCCRAVAGPAAELRECQAWMATGPLICYSLADLEHEGLQYLQMHHSAFTPVPQAGPLPQVGVCEPGNLLFGRRSSDSGTWCRLQVSWGDLHTSAKHTMHEVLVNEIGLDGRLALVPLPNSLPIVEWTMGYERAVPDVAASQMITGRRMMCRQFRVADDGRLSCELMISMHSPKSQDDVETLWKPVYAENNTQKLRCVNTAAENAVANALEAHRLRVEAGVLKAAQSAVLSLAQRRFDFYRTRHETPLLSLKRVPHVPEELSGLLKLVTIDETSAVGTIPKGTVIEARSEVTDALGCPYVLVCMPILRRPEVCAWVSKLTFDGLLSLESLSGDSVLVFRCVGSGSGFPVVSGSTKSQNGFGEGRRTYGTTRFPNGTVSPKELVVVEDIAPCQRFMDLPDDEPSLGITAHSRQLSLGTLETISGDTISDTVLLQDTAGIQLDAEGNRISGFVPLSHAAAHAEQLISKRAQVSVQMCMVKIYAARSAQGLPSDRIILQTQNSFTLAHDRSCPVRREPSFSAQVIGCLNKTQHHAMSKDKCPRRDEYGCIWIPIALSKQAEMSVVQYRHKNRRGTPVVWVPLWSMVAECVFTAELVLEQFANLVIDDVSSQEMLQCVSIELLAPDVLAAQMNRLETELAHLTNSDRRSQVSTFLTESDLEPQPESSASVTKSSGVENVQTPINYLDAIDGAAVWTRLSRKALKVDSNMADTEGVKVIAKMDVISGAVDQLYFLYTPTYSYHYDFAVEHLNETRSLTAFMHAFSDGNDRSLVLCTLVHYISQDIWAFELDTADPMENQQHLVYTVFRTVQSRTFFGSKLQFHAVSPQQETILAGQNLVPYVTTRALHKGVRYQAYTLGHVCGTLRYSESPQSDHTFGPTDIIYTPTVPTDIRVSAGLITGQLQTPLCHVGLRCSNRGTPNIAVLTPLLEAIVLPLLGKPVWFSASADGFQIEEISTELCAVVQASTRMPGSTAGAAASIQCPEALSGGFPPGTLLPISVLWHLPQYGVRFAGTKASNSAQIAQLLGEAGIPDAYVLPFSAYLQHAEKTCPAYESVSELTMADIQQRQANLLATPVDDKVVWSIACALLAKRWTKAILRSSTNTEDLADFNGAGLYESVSIQVPVASEWTDPAIGLPVISHAVATVWASVWSEQAAAERAAFSIDHTAVAMAVLIQPFLDSDAVTANGVALSDQGPRSSTVVNTLPGASERVTGPSPGVLAEQLLLHPNSTSGLPFDTELLFSCSLTSVNESVLTFSECKILHQAILKLKTEMGTGLNVEFLFVARDSDSSTGQILVVLQARPCKQEPGRSVGMTISWHRSTPPTTGLSALMRVEGAPLMSVNCAVTIPQHYDGSIFSWRPAKTSGECTFELGVTKGIIVLRMSQQRNRNDIESSGEGFITEVLAGRSEVADGKMHAIGFTCGRAEASGTMLVQVYVDGHADGPPTLIPASGIICDENELILLVAQLAVSAKAVTLWNRFLSYSEMAVNQSYAHTLLHGRGPA